MGCILHLVCKNPVIQPASAPENIERTIPSTKCPLKAHIADVASPNVKLPKEGMKKGAQNAYLQVVEGNDNARALYRSLGFQQLYTYWFRVQPDENGNFPPEK